MANSPKLFRVTVFILAMIPLSAGLAGVFRGTEFPGFLVESGNADGPSHFRFLSGIFLAMGLAYWSCAFNWGNATWGGPLPRFRLLCALTIAGGLARLLSVLLDGTPSNGHLVGLGMELIVVPLLLVWSFRFTPELES